MKIDDPIARHGDRVCVLNYRKHPPQWEDGIADDPVFYLGNHPPPGSWHYKVWLTRRSSTDRIISVNVGFAGIKKSAGRSETPRS